MKKIISIIVLIVLLFQSGSKFAYVIDYVVNKEFIAKNLCENKDKPNMNCQGKCHLKKQLDRSEQSESQGKKDAKEKWEDQFFTSREDVFPRKATTLQDRSIYKEDPVTGFPSLIYQPPKA